MIKEFNDVQINCTSEAMDRRDVPFLLREIMTKMNEIIHAVNGHVFANENEVEELIENIRKDATEGLDVESILRRRMVFNGKRDITHGGSGKWDGMFKVYGTFPECTTPGKAESLPVWYDLYRPPKGAKCDIVIRGTGRVIRQATFDGVAWRIGEVSVGISDVLRWRFSDGK